MPLDEVIGAKIDVLMSELGEVVRLLEGLHSPHSVVVRIEILQLLDALLEDLCDLLLWRLDVDFGNFFLGHDIPYLLHVLALVVKLSG